MKETNQLKLLLRDYKKNKCDRTYSMIYKRIEELIDFNLFRFCINNQLLKDEIRSHLNIIILTKIEMITAADNPGGYIQQLIRNRIRNYFRDQQVKERRTIKAETTFSRRNLDYSTTDINFDVKCR